MSKSGALLASLCPYTSHYRNRKSLMPRQVAEPHLEDGVICRPLWPASDSCTANSAIQGDFSGVRSPYGTIVRHGYGVDECGIAGPHLHLLDEGTDESPGLGQLSSLNSLISLAKPGGATKHRRLHAACALDGDGHEQDAGRVRRPRAGRSLRPSAPILHTTGIASP